MKPETTDIIDVEAIDSTNSKLESIQSEWFKSAEAQHQTRLDKSGFQRAIAELIKTHNCPVHLLRRGEARNTEYSKFAVALIRSLRSGDKESLQELLRFAPTDSVSTSALAIATKNNQLASNCDRAADENFKAAKTSLNNGLADWRLLGSSLAKKVAKEIKAGFAEEFNSEMQSLGVQAQDVFNVGD